MKSSRAIFWVFGVAVFVLSLAQPAYAAGCGQNGGRHARTTPASTTSGSNGSSQAPAPASTGTAAGAGMLRD